MEYWRKHKNVFVAGLAKFKKHKFERVLESPVLERNEHDPFLTATCVLKENGIFRMWYVSGDSWFKNNETLPKYNIKYAELKIV